MPRAATLYVSTPCFAAQRIFPLINRLVYAFRGVGALFCGLIVPVTRVWGPPANQARLQFVAPAGPCGMAGCSCGMPAGSALRPLSRFVTPPIPWRLQSLAFEVRILALVPRYGEDI